MATQKQMQQSAAQKVFDRNRAFTEAVHDGLTLEELETNIARETQLIAAGLRKAENAIWVPFQGYLDKQSLINKEERDYINETVLHLQKKGLTESVAAHPQLADLIEPTEESVKRRLYTMSRPLRRETLGMSESNNPPAEVKGDLLEGFVLLDSQSYLRALPDPEGESGVFYVRSGCFDLDTGRQCRINVADIVDGHHAPNPLQDRPELKDIDPDLVKAAAYFDKYKMAPASATTSLSAEDRHSKTSQSLAKISDFMQISLNDPVLMTLRENLAAERQTTFGTAPSL